MGIFSLKELQEDQSKITEEQLRRCKIKHGIYCKEDKWNEL